MQIYFLCTGNACRSQMAEGLARRRHPEWMVASAGIAPQTLDPSAVAVMAELGIDISSQRATPIDPTYFAASDLVVTLCGDARDHCPTLPAGTRQRHWDLPDPAGKALATFRQVRDEIDHYLQKLGEN